MFFINQMSKKIVANSIEFMNFVQSFKISSFFVLNNWENTIFDRFFMKPSNTSARQFSFFSHRHSYTPNDTKFQCLSFGTTADYSSFSCCCYRMNIFGKKMWKEDLLLLPLPHSKFDTLQRPSLNLYII